MCRDTRIPIMHYDTLSPSTVILDICLIEDESYMAASRRGPDVNVADMVEQAQGADPSIQKLADPTQPFFLFSLAGPPNH